MRLEKYLPNLIHTDQTGFIKGRYIGQNIRLLSDVLDYAIIRNFQEFSFTLTSRKLSTLQSGISISKTLEVFNFGPKFRNWFSILYNGTQSPVINGGYTTDYF